MKSQTVIIREFQASDLTQIIHLFKDTVHAINKYDYSYAQLKAWAPDELDVEQWSKSLAEHITYVAVIDGYIVGFADMSKTGYLDRMYVHKDYQGRLISKRLGKALYNAALKLNLKEITSDVSITAMPLAKRLGFELIYQQEVEVRGERFINYHMVMRLRPCPKL